MSKPVKVGIFLVAGVCLFCLGLFLIGSSSNLFGSHFTVYAQFKDLNTLTSGSMVRVAGMSAGKITGIAVPKKPSQPFRLTLHVDDKFRSIVRTDSVASIATEGMVGNQYVNIAMGSAKAPECSGCTLHAKEAVSMDALMQKGSQLADSLQSTISDLHTRADTVMQGIDTTIGNTNGLIAGAKPSVIQTTRNIDALTTGMRQGKGAAGKLLTDPKVASNVSATIANAQQATTNLKQSAKEVNDIVSTIQKTDLPKIDAAVSNAQSMTGQVNKAVGTALAKGNHSESTAEALNDTIHGAQSATTNLSDDTDALKHNFFLRGFFNRRGFFDLETLTPSKYEQSDFVKKAKARVWIAADGLFATGADGTQQLTDEGRRIVDQHMSGLVRYLPNNPVVVEGYASAGAADQQYVGSRQRAVAVSQYLEARYHLKAEQVGIMPLGNHPPAHTGKSHWDGICLALVVSQK